MDEFNNYVAPSTLLITLDAAPPVSTLEAIEGVARVEKVDPRNYRLQFDASKDISEQVVQLSVANGWQLSEIQLVNAISIYENNIKDNQKRIEHAILLTDSVVDSYYLHVSIRYGLR